MHRRFPRLCNKAVAAAPAIEIVIVAVAAVSVGICVLDGKHTKFGIAPDPAVRVQFL